MTNAELPWISGDEVSARVSIDVAIRTVQAHLKAGHTPANDLKRSIYDVENGQLLVMPSRSSNFVGIKLVSVAPRNPALARERIQGVYVLMDAATLSPIALIDGAALTALRTPAVSAAAADYLAPGTVDHLLVFGSGPQAWGHIEAMRAIRNVSRVTIVARNQRRANEIVARVQAEGLPARVGNRDDVRNAQMIICATTSRTPLFNGSLAPTDSLTVAIGSHEADARELDSALAVRAQIVVEDAEAALREAGDVIIPITEGLIDSTSLVPMHEIITGATPVDHSRPRVFKSTGMSWEDLLIAVELCRVG
jgi:ornithine cyclodeaminase